MYGASLIAHFMLATVLKLTEGFLYQHRIALLADNTFAAINQKSLLHPICSSSNNRIISLIYLERQGLLCLLS
ncbi:hypothetical protein [Sodalis sp.]|uniref:hypothetical protein n=1 Tax=Sodalis sp. (in: enterobacteria) TaxID=1898979 RepID=UPI00387329A7